MIFACAILMFQWCRMQNVGVRVFKVDTFSVSWFSYVSGSGRFNDSRRQAFFKCVIFERCPAKGRASVVTTAICGYSLMFQVVESLFRFPRVSFLEDVL